MRGLLAAAAMAALIGSAAAQTTTSTTSSTTQTTVPGATQIESTSHTTTSTHTSSSNSNHSTTSTGPSTPPAAPSEPPAPPNMNSGAPNWSAPAAPSNPAAAARADFNAPSSMPNYGQGYAPPLMQPQYIERIVLYERADMHGRSIGVTLDTPNLASRHFAALASSVRVQGGAWELCEQVNYGGPCHQVDANTDLQAAGWAGRIQSIRHAQKD